MMDNLLEQIALIDERIDQYELKIYRLKERREELTDELAQESAKQIAGDEIDYHRMKL